MNLDYLLYDNRTQGPSGRDWGLKAATGLLKEDRQARQHFVEYCRRSFKSTVRIPANFGAAIGGFPIGVDGYVLCVTLETQDLFGRPACAFVGLHCPSRRDLLCLLEEHDPVVTAQAAYEKDVLPPHLPSRGRSFIGRSDFSRGPKMVVHESGARFGPFDRRSPRSAACLICKAARSGSSLPSILGIASWISSKMLLSSPDQFSFFQHLPATFSQKAKTVTEEVVSRTDDRVVYRAQELSRAPVLWVALIVIVVAVLLLFWAIGVSPTGPDRFPSRSQAETISPRQSEESRDAGTLPEETTTLQSDADFLERIKVLVSDLDRLDSRNLKSSMIYKILQDVQVMPQYQENRAVIRNALDGDFPAFRVSVLESENLDYYFSDPAVKNLSDLERAQAVAAKLQDLQIPVEGCHQLDKAFGALMERREDAPAIWCAVVYGFAGERENVESE